MSHVIDLIDRVESRPMKLKDLLPIIIGDMQDQSIGLLVHHLHKFHAKLYGRLCLAAILTYLLYVYMKKCRNFQMEVVMIRVHPNRFLYGIVDILLLRTSSYMFLREN